MSASPPPFDLAALASAVLAADRRAASRQSVAPAPAAVVYVPSAPAEASPPTQTPVPAAPAASPAPAETQGSPVVEMTTAPPAPAVASRPAGTKRGPKKRGPKPKSEAERRTHCVSVWVNAAELEAIDRRRAHLAPGEKLTPEALECKPARGEWLRVIEAGAVPPAPPTALNLEAWRKLATALGNLNQIAHALNVDAKSGGVRATLDAEIKRTLAEVRAFRDALIGADLPRAARASRAERSPKRAPELRVA